MSIIDLVLT